MNSKTAVFTIVSLNYGAYARTLMESVSLVHPEWERHVLVVDRCDDPAAVGGDLFATSLVEDLALPKMREFFFRYDIMELNTAAKPYMFAKLRREGYERVIYIDPDILVLARLEHVEKLLDDGAAAVVTPHLTAPIEDEYVPTERDIMRAGAYNLGFLAIGGVPAADAFINWWQRKLEYEAASDLSKGLFTDQKWVDMAPGMFGGFAILRNPGYNVAYWNLAHRPVTKPADAWLADGEPLRFFHFSGFDPQNPQKFSKHQNRFTLDDIGPTGALALEYAAKVLGHDYAAFRVRRYAFGSFDNGVPIPAAIRYLYREDANIRFAAGDNPFAAAEYLTFGELGGLPIVLRALWEQHAHLQRVFPDPMGSSRELFYTWFVEAGAIELGIADAFIQPIRTTLASAALAAGEEQAGSLAGMSIWARGLVYLHRRVSGNPPGGARMMQYRSVTSLKQFAKLGFRQFRASRLARIVGMHVPADAIGDMIRVMAANSAARPRRLAQDWRNDHVFGLFPAVGQDAWWAGSQVRIRLDQFNGTYVRLVGTHQGALHERAHGQPDMHLEIGIGSGARQRVKLVPGPFDFTLNLEWLADAWPAVLHIVPEYSFVPSEVGLGDDQRRLSFQLARIENGDAVVFDATTQHGDWAHAARPIPGAPGVNVIGYARSEHGLGQSLRQFVLALDAGDIANSIIDFNHNNLSRVDDASLDKRIVAEPAHRINVFHINADQMPQAELFLPDHVLRRYNIGFWHWELPDMLDEHMTGFRRLDEVWVPTAFVQEAVAKRSPIPVVRMPHAIEFAVSRGASRARFGLPEGKFLFLMMYDFSSYQERKNPRAALEAFDRAFGHDDPRAVLVIKTQNAQFHNQDVQALREAIADRSNVVWINETLSRQEVYDLQSVCDALVSLHRSEGFGLGPAEAMFLGKPVIATNWSGNTEFMRQDNSLPVNYRLVTIVKDIGVYRAGQTWAEPDIGHAATLMRRIVEDGALREAIGAEAMRTMREEFSPAAINRRIRERLLFIQENFLNG